MISEAASSKKYVLIFQAEGLSRKHRHFLKHFAQQQYIYLTKPRDLGGRIEELWLNKPQRKALSDNLLIEEAVKKLL
jgi:mitochondrial fission protein ELM1